MSPFSNPDSRSANREAALNADKKASDLHEIVWKLERRVEQQTVVIHALFSLLSAASGVTVEKLAAEVKRIEQERREAQPVQCGRCGRTVGARASQCLYCGESRVVTSPFDLL